VSLFHDHIRLSKRDANVTTAPTIFSNVPETDLIKDPMKNKVLREKRDIKDAVSERKRGRFFLILSYVKSYINM
jgi:hypothetical protein